VTRFGTTSYGSSAGGDEGNGDVPRFGLDEADAVAEYLVRQLL